MSRKAMPDKSVKATVKVEGQAGDAQRVSVCAGTACSFAGSLAVRDAFRDEVVAAGLQDRVAVTVVGCHGLCSEAPVSVLSDGTFYPHLDPAQVGIVVREHLAKGRPVDKLLYRDPLDDVAVRDVNEIGFYKHQARVALRNMGVVDPESIDDALAHSAYEAARSAFADKPAAWVIDQVTTAGRRDADGSATGAKWQLAALSPGGAKYVICNADEGDPGASVGCAILAGDPHSVIEGMILAAYAVGAHEGFVYVRAGHPLAVRRLRGAVAAATERGYLGADVLGSGWAFNLRVKEDAGALVCGQNAALLATIEGRRGTPATEPADATVSGLWGMPTVISDAETYAVVPVIVAGAAEGRGAGRDAGRDAGTKAFVLAGHVARGGLVEVPLGVTVQHVVFEIGGGVKNGRELKAVQLGGPAGGCLPAELLEMPLDHEHLTAAGAALGIGGLLVLDDSTCMVDLARQFLRFMHGESCGKCVPCRLGTRRMLEVLDRIVAGDGRTGDVELLEELGDYIAEGTLCALGGSAPSPVLTSIAHFREEWQAHVDEKRCPAGRCRELAALAGGR
jgi:NADH:ubiquinone oxidoreductase subunit F (NADH-binding)/(2Fe-2S) ferredoxin